jgi:hypothetical protein
MNITGQFILSFFVQFSPPPLKSIKNENESELLADLLALHKIRRKVETTHG